MGGVPGGFVGAGAGGFVGVAGGVVGFVGVTGGLTAGFSGGALPSGTAGPGGVSGTVAAVGGTAAVPRSSGGTVVVELCLNAPAPQATSPMLRTATMPATARMRPLLLRSSPPPWLGPRGTEACGTPPGVA